MGLTGRYDATLKGNLRLPIHSINSQLVFLLFLPNFILGFVLFWNLRCTRTHEHKHSHPQSEEEKKEEEE